MTGAVPFPMFLKSVPVYRMSREQFGEFWFTTEVYMRINLRSVPLLPIPDNIEVRVSLQDIVINGAARSARDAAPGSGEPEITEEDIAAGFWLSAEANDDTLAAYWGQIGQQWQDEVTEEAVAVTLSPARVDSLTEVGSARLLDLREGSLWRLETDFRKMPTFNRSQGFVPKIGVTLQKLGPDNPRLDLTTGYGLANKRSVFVGELEVPLLRSRWHLAGTANDGKKFLGAQYRLLSLHLAGRKDSSMFGGDGRRDTRAASALFYGSDPNHYYEERGFDGELRLRLTRGLALRGGGGYAEHRPWAQHTSWNVLDRRLSPAGNLAADFLDDSFAYASADWNWGALSLDGDVTWHELSGFAPGSSLREIQVSGQLDLLDGLGNQWLLRGAHREFDGTAPVQWKSWLGDHGTLRGYEAGELTGDAGTHASLDARFGWDIWRAARVPILKNWGLQPIGFVDWGHTWDNGEGANGPGEGERDWRLDVGFGFGKRFDLPGLGKFRNVRIYAAHPVSEDHEGQGWRFILAFEP